MKNNEALKAIEHLLDLHTAEQEGIESGMPTAQQWREAYQKAVEALEVLKQSNQSEYIKSLQEPIEDILCNGIVNCEEVDLTAQKIIDLIINKEAK